MTTVTPGKAGQQQMDWMRLSPSQVLAVGYLVIIILGTMLLMMPGATSNGKGMDFVAALFTSTSAVCVTGLSIVDVGSYLSVFGQVVLIVLVEIGSLGFMTISTLFALALGRRITLRDRLFIKEDLNHSYISGIVRLVRKVLGVTCLIEALGALLLWIAFSSHYGFGKGLYYAIFHAISAFGNAGFSLMSNSFSDYAANSLVTLTIASLIIVGGIGFAVIVDLVRIVRYREISLHTRIVVRVSLWLIVTGMLLVMAFEWENPSTLGSLDVTGKLLAGFFTSVTARTAGFESVPTGAFRPATLFVMMILMFIGASPGSTGGGIKTTTFATLVHGIWTVIRGKRDIEIGNRRLSGEDFGKAVAITGLAAALILLVTMLLLITQPHLDFTQLLFEATSAFGTVGLSTGITAKLNNIGRVLLVFTMFAGRVGPLTLAMAISQSRTAVGVRYPEEKISLG